MAYIISGSVPGSGFHNDNITSLLEDLTETIAARYQRPPGFASNRTRSLPGQSSANKALLANIEVHKAKLAALETSDWMLETFRKVTVNRHEWPPADKSEENPLSYSDIRERKRKSDLDFEQPSRLPRQRETFSSHVEEDD